MLRFWVILTITGLRALSTKATNTTAPATPVFTNTTTTSNETATLATTTSAVTNGTPNETNKTTTSSNETVTLPTRTFTQRNDTRNQTYTTATSSNDTVTLATITVMQWNDTLNEANTITPLSNQTVTLATTTVMQPNYTLNENNTTTPSSNETVTLATTTVMQPNYTLKENNTTTPSSNETVTLATTTVMQPNYTLIETNTTIPSSNETVTLATTTVMQPNYTLNENNTTTPSSNETVTLATTTVMQPNYTINENYTSTLSSNETVTLSTTTVMQRNDTLNETNTTTQSSSQSVSSRSSTPSSESVTWTTATPFYTIPTNAPIVSQAVSTEGEMTIQSTTGRTTTLTNRQTTTHSPYQQPPNFGAAPPFKISFTIGFNRIWIIELGNTSSNEFRLFKYQVEQEIDKAFQGCPGYIPFSANVISFFNISDAVTPPPQRAQSLVRSEGVPTLQATESNVHAAYQTSFDNKVILESGDATVNHIDTQTKPKLGAALINGSVGVLHESLTDMTAIANSNISDLQSNPCQAIGTFICTICYPCTSPTPTDVTCLATCRDDNKICTVAGNDTTGCNCKSKYLPVGEGCVHENVIIGTTVGVVGAVLLGLVIAVLVLCCTIEKKENHQESYDLGQPHELVKVQGIDKVVEGRPVATGEDDFVEFATITRVVDNNSLDQNSLATRELERYTRVVSSGALSSSSSDLSSTQTQNTSLYQRYPFTISSELKDEDLPREITESQVFATFVPRLDNIDTNKRYHIRRPTIQLQPISISLMPVESDSFF